MQKVNFLSDKYKTEERQDNTLVGICDPKGEKPAYTTIDVNNTDKWIAIIKNDEKKWFTFVPVDKNIILKRDNGEKAKSCDGMILFEENICFVELKDKRAYGWLKDAIEQLKETILFFNECHQYKSFHIRRAYAANCVHPHFQYAHKDILIKFKNETHFRLYPEDTIKL